MKFTVWKVAVLGVFWSVFSDIRTEYRDTEIESISPYSIWMRENMGQKKSEYGHFLRSVPAGSEPVCVHLYETSM